MTATNHFLAGAIIGEYIDNPGLAFTAGVASHLVLDSIPHFDFDQYLPKKWQQTLALALDLFIWGALIILFVSRVPLKPSVFTAVFGAVIIDLFDNVPFWKNQFRQTKFGQWLHQWHDGIHHTLPKKYFLLALIIEILTMAGLIFWLSKF